MKTIVDLEMADFIEAHGKDIDHEESQAAKVGINRVLDEGWDPQDAHAEMVTDGFHAAFFGLNHYFEEQTGWED
ncbi:MAG: hypothetical protein ABIP39_01625 [Polyangiaceae bacterium]